MSDTVEIEIGDDTYEVEARTFSLPGKYRWNEPPESGELELDGTVLVVHGSDLPYSERHRERITMDAFLRIYAEHHDIQGPNLERFATAALRLDDEVYEVLRQRAEDDFDDRFV